MPNTNNTVANAAAFAVSKVVKANWMHTLQTVAPLLSMAVQESRFNSEGDVRGDGNFLLPVLYNDTGTNFEGVAYANQLTAMTRTIMDGATQARYVISHYRGMQSITARDMKRLSGGAGSYNGNVLQAKAEQVQNRIKDVLAPLVSGAAAGSETAIMGIRQALATANTVGAIDQSAQTYWRSNVDTSGGSLSRSKLNWGIRQIANKKGKCDLVALSEGGSVNLFLTMLDLVGNQQIITCDSEVAKSGHTSVIYAGTEMVGDMYITANEVLFLDTKTWFAVGDKEPTFNDPYIIPGTDATETTFTYMIGLGCNHPGRNARITGLVA